MANIDELEILVDTCSNKKTWRSFSFRLIWQIFLLQSRDYRLGKPEFSSWICRLCENSPSRTSNWELFILVVTIKSHFKTKSEFMSLFSLLRETSWARRKLSRCLLFHLQISTVRSSSVVDSKSSGSDITFSVRTLFFFSFVVFKFCLATSSILFADVFGFPRNQTCIIM